MSFDLPKALEPHLGFAPKAASISNAPFGGEVSVHMSENGDRIEVCFLTVDPYPAKSFFPEDGSLGTLRRFRSATARDRYLASLSRDDRVAFDVIRPGRGAFQPVTVGSQVDPLGVYSPPADRSDALRAGEITLASLHAEAADTLAAYSAWTRGEVFGVIRDCFRVDRDAERIQLLDTEKDWGHCGVERARLSARAQSAEQRGPVAAL